MKAIQVTKYQSNNGGIYDTSEEAIFDDFEREFNGIMNEDDSLYVSDWRCNAISDFRGLHSVMSMHPEFFDKVLTVIRAPE